MGKTWDRLQNQLNSENKVDAENCIEIYEYLQRINEGHVWDSQWNILVKSKRTGSYPNNTWIYHLTDIGRKVLRSLVEDRSVDLRSINYCIYCGSKVHDIGLGLLSCDNKECITYLSFISEESHQSIQTNKNLHD